MRILITGGRAPVALDLVRRFARQGHVVHLAESARLPLAGFSRYPAGRHRVAPPRQQPQRFDEQLEALVRKERIDLVIPTCEEVLWVRVAAFAPSFADLVELHNKWTFVQRARRLGLSVPDSWLLGDQPAGEHVYKPIYSRFGTATRIRPKIVPKHGDWIAQRYLPGKLLCSYSVVHEGRLAAHVCYRPSLHLQGGAGLLFEAVEHPGVLAWVETFAQGLSGQLSFDFIQGPDGSLAALECNPRATSGLHLFASDERLVQAFLGPGPCYHAEVGNRSILAAAALFSQPLGLLRSRARPVVCDWRDPLPALGQVFSFLEVVWQSRRQSLSLLESTTHDIQWP